MTWDVSSVSWLGMPSTFINPAKRGVFVRVIAAAPQCGIDLSQCFRKSCVARCSAGRSDPGAEFDDLRRDRLLPDAPQRRLERFQFTRDLAARRRHRLHPRFVLGGEGVERRLADLRVEVVLPESGDQRLLGELHHGAVTRCRWMIGKVDREKPLA